MCINSGIEQQPCSGEYYGPVITTGETGKHNSRIAICKVLFVCINSGIEQQPSNFSSGGTDT